MGPECFFVLDNYNDYLSGELDDESVKRIEKHIRVCPNCDVLLGKAIAFRGRTLALLRVPAPRALKESISALMEKI